MGHFWCRLMSTDTKYQFFVVGCHNTTNTKDALLGVWEGIFGVS
jgi:hypothetical protein